MDDVTTDRLAHNEGIFRAINEQVLALEERFGSRDGTFICECSDTTCLANVILPLAEYVRIHDAQGRFFVVPGHEQPEVETVVERHPNYVVVQKNDQPPEV